MTSCLKILVLSAVLVSSPSFGKISAYFNQSSTSSYTDSYRNIHRNGDDLEQVIIDHINVAKKSVFVAVQELRLPKIAEVLINKKNQGVDVRIVLEHDYNLSVSEQSDPNSEDEYEASRVSELRAFVDLNRNGKLEKSEIEERDAVYKLRNAGVKIIDDTFDNSSGSGLMHHKFIVVDNKQTLISTANFTMSCIHGDVLTPQSRGNPNSIVVVLSPLLAKHFEEEFKQLWGNGKRGNFGHNKTYRGPQVVKIGKSKITVQFSPTSARYTWMETVNGLISQHLKQAESTIKAALFVYSDQNIGNELENKFYEGLDLDFLVEQRFAYRNYSELLDMLGVEIYNNKCAYEADNKPWGKVNLKAGMAYLPKGDVLHHKFAVIDDSTVIMGSQNWSEAANYINDETLIVVENSDIAPLYTKEYDRLKSKSVQGLPRRAQVEMEDMEQMCSEMNYYFNQDLNFSF